MENLSEAVCSVLKSSPAWGRFETADPYALESSSQPLGVSAYELSNLMPENFKSSLPSIDEIEKELLKDAE